MGRKQNGNPHRGGKAGQEQVEERTKINQTYSKITIHRFRKRKARSVPWTVTPVLLILIMLFFFDPNVEWTIVWILGGILITLVILETGPSEEQIETSVTKYPVGVVQLSQRLLRRNGSTALRNIPKLIPLSCVESILNLEHVEAFSVSNHVLFRLKVDDDGYTYHHEQQELVPVFPGLQLSFAQCQYLKEALDESLRVKETDEENKKEQ